MTAPARDHGGGLDAACQRFGGKRIDWIDLSTGINPLPYPVTELPDACWTALPDHGALDRLIAAARQFWDVPAQAAVLAAPGASALIAQIPGLHPAANVAIPAPTYNEHAAAFSAWGWTVAQDAQQCAQVVVHPNNPDGSRWSEDQLPVRDAGLTVIDESFCDVCPDQSLVHLASRHGTIILKSFGKFWGLAGLRLGFAIGDPALVAQLNDRLGPWAVSGPALAVGARALEDTAWAQQTRHRLAQDADQLDRLMGSAGAEVVGGTTLFRLYRVARADEWQHRLARAQIWSRTFPYRDDWLRLGLPAPTDWPRLKAALR